MSVESIRRRIMLKREPKTGNLGQGTILSKSFIVCMYGIDTRTLTIYVKELSFCHKLWFSNPYIFTFQCQRP